MGYLKDLVLCFGEGEEGKVGCWMTTLQAHLNGKWTDRCVCVDPDINDLCILINDKYTDDEEGNKYRTAAILEFGIFAPLATLDPDSIETRYWHLFNYMVKNWIPVLLGDGHPGINYCKNYAKITDKTWANLFVDNFKLFLIHNHESLKHRLEDMAWAADDADMCASRLHAILDTVLDNATYHDSDKSINVLIDEAVKKYAFPALRELIDIGKHLPKESRRPVCSAKEFRERVGLAK